jgi:single-strand DNA-binding protein
MALPSITAVGNLVFDPDFAVTANGISRCKMRIACNERKKQDGEWVDGETSFFDIIVWRGLADAAGDNFKKGQTILVIGKVKISKYEDKNGVERQSVEILADELATVAKAPRNTQPTDDPWL